MKIQLERDGDVIEAKNIRVLIGATSYRLSETNQGTLEINKYDLYDADILVKPCYANQIEVR